ncbi:MAG TPA: TIGR03118 family protein [Opitutaceae bacterium]|jgi:uncharacterized protein (TIGR03118 family)
MNNHRGILAAAALLGALGTAPRGLCDPSTYTQTNLISDIPGEAETTDSNLVNPWGLSYSPTGPFWISDNGTGLSSVVTGTGTVDSLVVTVPPPAGGTSPSAPTGNVFNGTMGFDLNGTPAAFIFDTEDGTISAWNSGTTATLEVDNSASGAVYKGLALANNLLYATNFNAGTINVFNGSFGAATLAGSFSDPNMPAGYAPFNIAEINGVLFVTYAKQDAAKHDDVAGLGNGFIDEYTLSGTFISRFASNGQLDSPWGLTVAPSDFGTYSGDLLVGNFGDGEINAFDMNGDFVGTLDGGNGSPIVIPGLWGLDFGNGGSAGPADSLFFSAGIPGGGMVEDHGLFGDLTVPDSGTTATLLAAGLFALVPIGALRRRARLA